MTGTRRGYHRFYINNCCLDITAHFHPPPSKAPASARRAPARAHTHIHTHTRTHTFISCPATRAALCPPRSPGRPQPLSSSARWERPRAPRPSSPAARARGTAPGARTGLLSSWSSADGRCWKSEKPRMEPTPGRPKHPRASPLTAPTAPPRSGLRSAGAGG